MSLSLTLCSGACHGLYTLVNVLERALRLVTNLVWRTNRTPPVGQPQTRNEDCDAGKELVDG